MWLLGPFPVAWGAVLPAAGPAYRYGPRDLIDPRLLLARTLPRGAYRELRSLH